MEVGIPDGISRTSPHPALLPVPLFHTKPLKQDFTNSAHLDVMPRAKGEVLPAGCYFILLTGP